MDDDSDNDDMPDTRVFVSGLPPNFTSNLLGAHFAARYQITDAVVVPDRRIGFVGFRNYTLAKKAIKYFDKSYIRLSKISVEMAKPVEIQRTATSQRVPKSKHSGPDRKVGSANIKSQDHTSRTDPSAESVEQPPKTEAHTPNAVGPNSLSSNGRLFVRNLPFTVSESELRTLFLKYGPISEVHIVRNKSGASQGIAYVQFSKQEQAKHAFEALDGKPFQGRLLHIMESADKKSHKLDDYEVSQLPLKKQKTLKRKREAGGSTFNWNSMYMNPDAVLSSVADRLGVSKADLIDPTSADAAVKQAHAETHVIQETKAFFSSHGVDWNLFKQKERDDGVILAKNFPFGTTAEELKSLFGQHGEIAQCLLPPSGTIAVIQFTQPGDGRQAMKQVAYRNFKGSVLYLEKGPKGLLDKYQGHVSESKDGESHAVSKKEIDPNEHEKVSSSSSSTLFVRNLSFATTSSGLTEALKPLDGFLNARVKTKADPKRPQEILSMGFGFVEFRSIQQAQAALAALKGRRLDNHELVVQISNKSTDAAEEQRNRDNVKKSETHNTKLIIKNLPFEARKRDVRKLCEEYGKLRSVKVPKKFDDSTRGFAFADFVTAKEAGHAMEALKDTHLLGRRLVLEFAAEEAIDPEEEIRAIEAKVGRQTEMIHLKNMTGSTRKKFKVGVPDDDQ